MITATPRKLVVLLYESSRFSSEFRVTFSSLDEMGLPYDTSVSSRDRLVVRTLRCGRSNPGSNPGHGSDILHNSPTTVYPAICYLHKSKHLHVSVSGIVVSIAAFQAVDPGSIPG